MPQTVSQFAVQDHAAAEALGAPRFGDPVASASARAVVIVLGRGRLQGPSRGFDALFDFIDRRGLDAEGVRRSFVYETAARQDFEKLHATIEHLRHLDGEKHLILLSPEGLLDQRAAPP